MTREPQWKLLGGFVLLSDYLFLLLPLNLKDILNTIVLLIFIALNLRLIAKKEIKFFTRFSEKFPKTSVYLSAVGWVEYVVLFSFFIGLAILQTTERMELILPMVLYLAYFSYVSIFLSLLVCFLRQRKMQALDSGKMSE